jgi:Outer membrane protein beta-barrel domain
MTANIRVIGLAAAFSCISLAPLYGQIQLQSVNLSVLGGGYSTVHNVFNLQTGTTDDFKTGFTLGGSIGFQLHKYVELRASLIGAQSQLRVNGAETGTYLNRYYVGVDVKGEYPLAGGITPYGLAGGGFVVLHEKGATAGDNTQGFGHLGLGVAHSISGGLSLFLQADGFFYSLSGLTSPALSAYSSAQFDVAWSAGASYRFPL